MRFNFVFNVLYDGAGIIIYLSSAGHRICAPFDYGYGNYRGILPSEARSSNSFSSTITLVLLLTVDHNIKKIWDQLPSWNEFSK